MVAEQKVWRVTYLPLLLQLPFFLVVVFVLPANFKLVGYSTLVVGS